MSKLAVQIHKTVVELPMNFEELVMILSTDRIELRSAVELLLRQGLIKTDGEGRYIPARELTEDGIKIMSMVERVSA